MKKETQALYQMLAILETMRDLWRETAPDHKLIGGQKEKAKKLIKLFNEQFLILRRFVYGT